MSEQKWTAEPWEKDYGGTIGHIKSVVGYPESTPTVCRYDVMTPSLSEDEKQANAQRIVACVNACHGAPSAIQPKAVKALADVLEAFTRDGRLQTFEDRERFRKAARHALALYSGDQRRQAMNTPCSVSRDEVRHDLNAVEYTDEEIRKAELDAVADMLRVVAPKGHSLLEDLERRDGRTLAREALSDGLEASDLKDLTVDLQYQYATRQFNDEATGKFVRQALIENYVRGMPSFQDRVDHWLAHNRGAVAEQAELDRGNL